VEIDKLKEEAQFAAFASETRETALRKEIACLKENVNLLRESSTKKDQEVEALKLALAESSVKIQQLSTALQDRHSFAETSQKNLLQLKERGQRTDELIAKAEKRIEKTEEKTWTVVAELNTANALLHRFQQFIEKQASELDSKKAELSSFQKEKDVWLIFIWMMSFPFLVDSCSSASGIDRPRKCSGCGASDANRIGFQSSGS
jgi:chromosome segregation ATPase